MTTHRLQGRNVLIVDDDEDILSSIDLAIRAEGATTTKATDGSAAVLNFQAGDFDAVVLDMMLPKSSGFVVLEKIMEYEDPPPVIMITANQGKRHQQYAHDHGVTVYLTKPVPLQRLVDTVVKLVEARGTEPAAKPA
jgi:DNA-binding response OmpR family regulator